ncbi:hypothetical protein B0H66DRAFT_479101 [Apodospora peruviana]|uniref:SnoaL-like domain-containing protein n=1 Tax=Apodospora peruviana TaxID=516989 RepID=A0AAE0M216_9PEZI|nr:hypothetical protein B0H66DRAFT_479101 [Apodospora peruviana]
MATPTPSSPTTTTSLTTVKPAAALSATRMHTINSLLEGYSSLSIPKLLKPLAPVFTQSVLPRSLGMNTPRNRESFAQHAEGIFSVFEQFRLVPESIYEDEARGAVVVHARMEGTMKSNGGEWRNECIMLVKLSADGNQVVEIKEFVDSAKAVEMKKRHAPKDFDGNGADDGNGGLRLLVRNTMLVTGIAAGMFYGVRRMLQR